MWVGRATVFLVGLSVILALVFGIATTAVAGDGPGAVFNLGQKYTVNRLSQLVGTTALDLKVGKGTDPTTKTAPPMKVDSQAEVANLNAESRAPPTTLPTLIVPTPLARPPQPSPPRS